MSDTISNNISKSTSKFLSWNVMMGSHEVKYFLFCFSLVFLVLVVCFSFFFSFSFLKPYILYISLYCWTHFVIILNWFSNISQISHMQNKFRWRLPNVFTCFTILSCILANGAINVPSQWKGHRPFLFSHAPHVSSPVVPQTTHALGPTVLESQLWKTMYVWNRVNWYGQNLANHQIHGNIRCFLSAPAQQLNMQTFNVSHLDMSQPRLRARQR